MRFVIDAVLKRFGLTGGRPSIEDRLEGLVGIPEDDPLWDLEPPVDHGEFIDGAISGVAANLKYANEDPTYRVELLADARLDYSIASVELIDDYLEKIREDKMTNEEYLLVVLRCGAYLGECVRRNSQNDWHWMDFKTRSKKDKGLREMGSSIHNHLVLVAKTTTGFPLARIAKRLYNGKEDNLMDFAIALAGDLEKARNEGTQLDEFYMPMR